MFVEVINISDPENWPRDMEKYPTIVEYGVADVYKLGNIYYICYYQVDSSDDEVEIPEDAEFFEFPFIVFNSFVTRLLPSRPFRKFEYEGKAYKSFAAITLSLNSAV